MPAGLVRSEGVTPVIRWLPVGFERFRVHAPWDPGFGKGTRVTSGEDLLKKTSYVFSKKKWRRACENASPDLFIMVKGMSPDLPAGDPERELASGTVNLAP